MLSPLLIGLQFSAPSSLLNTPPMNVPVSIVYAVPAYTLVGLKGSIAMARILGWVSPLSIRLQLSPPLSLLNIPPAPLVPAYTVLGVAGSIASATTKGLVMPVLAGLQLSPPSSLLNAPPLPLVPAYRVAGVVGSIAKA